MAGIDVIDIALANSNTKNSLLGNGSLKGNPGKDGKSAYEIAVDNGFSGTETEWLESLKASGGDMPEDTKERIETLEEQMAELLYQAIEITSFASNRATNEIGSTVAVTLSWATNKTPKSLELDGADVTGTTSKAMGNVSADTTYTLVATDEKQSTSKTARVSFMNGVYYGVVAKQELANADILGLTRNLQTGKSRTFNLNIPNGSYGFYCVPTRYGDVSFNVGGFYGGFSKVQTISFTNASGYAESYDVYKTDNTNLDSIRVVAS